MPSEDNKSERAALLRKELRLAGISMRMLFPRWAKGKAVRESILLELLAALEAPIHEGLIPPYGSIIVPDVSDLQNSIPLQPDDIELGRKAADGSSALLAFGENGAARLVLLDPTGAPDLELARLARSLDGIAIRRERTGSVRIHGLSGSLRNIGRRWMVSPAIAVAIEKIRQVAPMAGFTVLWNLLEYAFYVLSPWSIGATLVWILSDRVPGENGVDLRPLQLGLSPSEGKPSLAFTAHLLAQFDGATMLSREGRFLTTGIHLNPSQRAQELIPQHRGTRHTSARRASFDLADALLITVSADGPVTVFSDGLSIFELWWFSAGEAAERMRKAYGSILEDAVWVSGRDKVCPNCGKTSHVEILTIAGWREREEALCPVCHETVDSAHCFNIHANIRKAF